MGDGAIDEQRPPRVFVSYSHDSEPHCERVLALAQRLRGQGVEAQFDRYEPSPAEGWIRWMERNVKAADFVLVVCTPNYRRSFEGDAGAAGLGVNFEGALMQKLIYADGQRNERFVPVFFEGDGGAIPLQLSGVTQYQVPNEYDALYRRLTGQPEVVPAALGERRQLPPREGQRRESSRTGPTPLVVTAVAVLIVFMLGGMGLRRLVYSDVVEAAAKSGFRDSAGSMVPSPFDQPPSPEFAPSAPAAQALPSSIPTAHAATPTQIGAPPKGSRRAKPRDVPVKQPPLARQELARGLPTSTPAEPSPASGVPLCPSFVKRELGDDTKLLCRCRPEGKVQTFGVKTAFAGTYGDSIEILSTPRCSARGDRS